MEYKDIDINNEEQILKGCDFDFFYNCELCSFELCMFYNDILCKANKLQSDFNVRSALIDLGRIAITFNIVAEIVKELEEENQQLIKQYDELNKKYCEEMDKNIALAEQLKQSQNRKAIEVCEDILNYITSAHGNHYPAAYEIINFINEKINQIKELRGE